MPDWAIVLLSFWFGGFVACIAIHARLFNGFKNLDGVDFFLFALWPAVIFSGDEIR